MQFCRSISGSKISQDLINALQISQMWLVQGQQLQISWRTICRRLSKGVASIFVSRNCPVGLSVSQVSTVTRQWYGVVVIGCLSDSPMPTVSCCFTHLCVSVVSRSPVSWCSSQGRPSADCVTVCHVDVGVSYSRLLYVIKLFQASKSDSLKSGVLLACLNIRLYLIKHL